MNYTIETRLDIDPGGVPPVVKSKQGDGFARFLKIQLTKDGLNYTPESGVWFMFRCEKPDGHAVIEDSVTPDTELDRYLIVNQGNGIVQVELVDQVSTCAGRCKCDLVLLKNEQILSTIPFVIYVVPAPDVANTAISSDDFRTLSNLVDDLQHIIESFMPEIMEEFDEIKGEITPHTADLTLPYADWAGESSPYTQTVTIAGASVTDGTKVDLSGGPAVYAAMTASNTSQILIINEDGVLTAYAFGGKPNANLTLQASLTAAEPI